jgi:hypothetical protein
MTRTEVAAVAENYAGEAVDIVEITAAVGAAAAWIGGVYCATEEIEVCTGADAALSRRARIFARQHAARLNGSGGTVAAVGPRAVTPADIDADGNAVGGEFIDGNTFIETDGTAPPPMGRAEARARWYALTAATTAQRRSGRDCARDVF